MSTYSQLKKIIPPDQALANKALEAAFQQIKAIFNSNPVLLGTATQVLESNKNLSLINALTTPIPAAVLDYYTQTFANGTGTDGTLLLADIIGTPSGWVHNAALQSVIDILNTLIAANALTTLTDGTNGVFTVMQNTIDGDYGSGPVTIPGGLPGAGTYATVDLAFTVGLIPAANTLLNTIASANSTAVATANTDWNNIAGQLVLENTNLAAAGIIFADLVAGASPAPLVNQLSQYALDTAQGGAAYIMEALAQTSTLGGQAVVSTMREARNQVLLSSAGIETDSIVSNEIVEPQADLGDSQYTAQEAINQKII